MVSFLYGKIGLSTLTPKENRRLHAISSDLGFILPGRTVEKDLCRYDPDLYQPNGDKPIPSINRQEIGGKAQDRAGPDVGFPMCNSGKAVRFFRFPGDWLQYAEIACGIGR